MRAVQEQAAAKGFHRVHDVSPKGDITTDYAPLQSLYQHSLPQVNDKGELNLLNKAKLWFHEGSEAIPVARMKPGEKAFVPGHPGGKHVGEGVVFDRTALPGSEHAIIGGTDAEGPMHVQQAMSNLGDAGKGVEADLLQRYAPGVMPKTFTDLHSIVGGPLQGTRAEQARMMQQKIRDHLKGQGVDAWAMKPTHGLDSRSEFPSSKQDWGKMIEEYDAHMANPANAAELQKHIQSGNWSELTEHLHDNEIYAHHALSEAMKDPRKAIAQHWMPGAAGEWRVHTVGGGAPSELMMVRNARDLARGAFTGKNDEMKAPMKKFVEEEVLAKLPEEYRRGMHGMDVMPFRMPDGSVQFKVMELNPHGLSSAASGGGGSGLLEPDILPGAGWKHYKAMTGRDAEAPAMMKALGVGAAAGGTARLLTDEEDDKPHPVG